MDSILESIKKLLGIPSEYTHFDDDLIIDINSIFLHIAQLGVGPTTPVAITGSDETWSGLFGDVASLIPSIRSYTHLKVRLLFDPPTNSGQIESINKLADEIEWRMYIEADPVENESNSDSDTSDDTSADSAYYTVSADDVAADDYGIALADFGLETSAVAAYSGVTLTGTEENTGPTDPFEFVKSAQNANDTEIDNSYVGPSTYQSFKTAVANNTSAQTETVGSVSYATFLQSTKKSDEKTTVGSIDPLKFIQTARSKKSS